MLIGIAEYVNNHYQFEIKGNERNEIRKKIKKDVPDNKHKSVI